MANPILAIDSLEQKLFDTMAWIRRNYFRQKELLKRNPKHIPNSEAFNFADPLNIIEPYKPKLSFFRNKRFTITYLN